MTIHFMSILLLISVLSCTLCIIGLLYIYRSVEHSLSALSDNAYIVELHLRDLRARLIGRSYESGFSSMAEDTEVAE